MVMYDLMRLVRLVVISYYYIFFGQWLLWLIPGCVVIGITNLVVYPYCLSGNNIGLLLVFILGYSGLYYMSIIKGYRGYIVYYSLGHYGIRLLWLYQIIQQGIVGLRYRWYCYYYYMGLYGLSYFIQLQGVSLV